MTQLLPERRIPTPFGPVHLPQLSTPPMQLPSKPNESGKAAIKQALGQDVADLIDTALDLIPGADIVGGLLDPLKDQLTGLHAKEIQRIMTPEEYNCYLEHHKIFPSTVAAVRCTCFKEVGAKAKGKSEGIRNLLPQNPKIGPPLPAGMHISWPKGAK